MAALASIGMGIALVGTFAPGAQPRADAASTSKGVDTTAAAAASANDEATSEPEGSADAGADDGQAPAGVAREGDGAAEDDTDAPAPLADPIEPLRDGLRRGFAWDFEGGSRLQLGALVTGQGILALDEVEGAEAGFRLQHVRTQIAASFFDGRLQAVVQPELANGARLLDAEVAAFLNANFGVRGGFYRPRFMRDFRVNIPFIALPTRGFVHDHFSTGRRVGIAIEGQPLDGRFEYAAGVYNGAGGSFPGDDTPANALLMARVAVNPLGPTPYTQTPGLALRDGGIDGPRVSVGLNVASEAAPLNAAPEDGTKAVFSQRTTFAADATFLHPKGWLSATGIRRWHPSPNGPQGSSGGYIMGGIPLGKSAFDLVARTGAIDGAGPLRSQHEGAVNAYLVGNHLRVSVAYLCERTRETSLGCARHSFTTQMRLTF